MNRAYRSRVIAALLLLLLSALSLAWVKKEQASLGRSGGSLSREALAEDLSQHKRWLNSAGKDGRLIEYFGVDLSNLDLSGEDLRNATFSYYWRVNSDDNTITTITKLRGANLSRTELKGAIIREADVFRAIFEPFSNPDARSFATAENLEFLTYQHDPSALVLLRKEFEEDGFREQERKITYALKRREAELSWEACRSHVPDGEARSVIWSSDSNAANCSSFFLNRVFFDWTCQYGMSPWRPLLIGLCLWAVCSLLYFVCVHTAGKPGLYRVQGGDLETDPSTHKDITRIQVQSLPAKCRVLRFLRREVRAFGTAMFFSLMSAFNIGFRDMNFGRWLRLLTRQPFDIKALGWVRVVAGWQSLVSGLMVALWLLTYFGRPFE